MEKLIELLNEWERERVNHNMKEFIPYGKSSFSDLSVERITSKKYWFIKWLVENDKIDIKALVVKGEMRSWWDFDNKKWNEESGEKIWNKYYSELCLMILAIQDEPINFLISILK